MRKLFSENLGLKLFSLVLAALLEFYFYSSENAISETVLVRAQLRNLPADMMEVGSSFDQKNSGIKLKVSGPSQLIERMRLSPVNYIVDLPDPLQGNYATKIDPENFTLPIGVNILDYYPREVEFSFEKVLRKNLKIDLVTKGKVSKGYELKSTQVKPASIYVSGPVSELKGLTLVKTKPVDISNIFTPTKRELRLETVGPLTTMDINVASADIVISPILKERSISRLPIVLNNLKGKRGSLSSSFASVRIRGPKNKISSLKSEQILVSVDAGAVDVSKSKTIELPLKFVLPEGFDLEEYSPKTVEVRIIEDAVGSLE